MTKPLTESFFKSLGDQNSITTRVLAQTSLLSRHKHSRPYQNDDAYASIYQPYINRRRRIFHWIFLYQDNILGTVHSHSHQSIPLLLTSYLLPTLCLNLSAALSDEDLFSDQQMISSWNLCRIPPTILFSKYCRQKSTSHNDKSWTKFLKNDQDNE